MPKIRFNAALINSTTLFDDSITPIIREKYPKLTNKQHVEHTYIALHEAGHLVAALKSETGTVGPYGYIRIPGKSSWNILNRGISGKVTCDGYKEDDAIISYAGYIASLMIDDPDAEIISADDITYADKVLNWSLKERCGFQDEDTVAEYIKLYMDCTAALVLRNWGIIEKAAIGMIICADSRGDIRGNMWGELVNYLIEKLKQPLPWYEYDCAYSPDRWWREGVSACGMGLSII